MVSLPSSDGIFVDFDGTLVDTEVANAQAYADALKSFGYNISPILILPLIKGRNWRVFLPEAIALATSSSPLLEFENLEEIAKKKQHIYPKYLKSDLINTELVEILKNHPARKVLVTNASQGSILQFLTDTQLDKLFDAIITGDDVTNPKPHPEPYAKAAAILDLQADECVVIEDSATGVASAEAFGASVLLIQNITPKWRHT